MRIGLDATPLSVPRAGVGTYTANLLRALAESADDQVIPFLHRSVHPSFARDLEGIGCDLEPERTSLIKSLWMQTRLRRRIRRERVDLCHFTNAVAPLRCPAPYVVTIHDAGLWLHPEYHYFRRLVSMRPLLPHVARRAAAVITVSHAVREELLEILDLPGSRVHVVHQGISAHFQHHPDASALRCVREQFELPERFVLSVGALEPRKNLVRLIEAYTALIDTPEAQGLGLVIVGPRGWKSAPLEAALDGVSPDLPVSVLGPVSDRALLCLYHLAEVLAFPSLYEGFGLPVVEAMTCGTPVVTSGRGALAEIAGESAELVDPERTDSIADGLLRVISDPGHADRLRRRGRERARAFTWARAVRETRAVYRSVLRDDAGAPGGVRPPSSTAAKRPSETDARPPGRSPKEARSLEEAIVRACAYADVFDFPLTAEEIHRYLVGASADLNDVRQALEDGELTRRLLEPRGRFYPLRGRGDTVDLRTRRGEIADRLWPDAVRYGRVLARVPFVRMVAVTGSLAAGNANADADIDYLIVTEPGRLWLCRALVIVVVRRAARRGVTLCPNYFLSESALALEERDLYTAWELAQTVPIWGTETFRRLRTENRWTEHFLPNARATRRPPLDSLDTPRRGNPWKRVAEVMLRSPLGGALERWERRRKIRRFTRSGPSEGDDVSPLGGDARFGADRCKGHFDTQAREVLARYRAREAALDA